MDHCLKTETGVSPLSPYCKMEIFIPESHLEALRKALQDADAGHIGKYDSCLSYSKVTGCWRPLEGTSPYLGTLNEVCEAEELKVEVTVRLERLEETMQAVLAVHPYEEPVINVIPLLRTGIREQREPAVSAENDGEKEDLPRKAAVLIPIVREKDGPAILLEVRSMKVLQPGEICFPGGHIEPGESSVETALRETYEELGIPPASVKVIRELEPELHLGKMQVFPVLAEIDPFEPEKLALPEEEVGGVFTLPFAWLRENEPAVYELGGQEREDLPEKLRRYLGNYSPGGSGGTTFYWEYGPYGIWGLTARILNKVRPALPEE